MYQKSNHYTKHVSQKYIKIDQLPIIQYNRKKPSSKTYKGMSLTTRISKYKIFQITKSVIKLTFINGQTHRQTPQIGMIFYFGTLG